MKVIDLLRFGFKNIGRQKVRSSLTIFAVVIGATSVMATLTIAFTAKNVLLSQIESAGALTQLTVSPDGEVEGGDLFNVNGSSDSAIKITSETVSKLSALEHVKSATPLLALYQLRSAALVGDSGKRANIDQTLGTIPGPETDKELSAGRNLRADDKAAMVIGSRYVESFGFAGNPEGIIGKKIQFSTKGYTGLDKDIPKPPFNSSREAGEAYNNEMRDHVSIIEVTVVGVMSSALFERQAYVPMSFGRQLGIQRYWEPVEQKQGVNRNGFSPSAPELVLKEQDMFDQYGYSAVIMMADSTDNVTSIAEKVKAMKLGVATAQEMIEEFLKIFNVVALVLGAIGAISLFVAAIGVINTMIMATLERTKEIGLLRASGATRSTVRRLFTFEASLLGMVGGAIGVGVAYGAVILARHFGAEELAKQGIDAAVISIPLWLAFSTVAITTFIGMLAGLLPAIRASRLNPIEALRYE